ncbi:MULTISPECIES: TolC family protein [unclassified Cobetia]|uniref:TolC family protein n=1 Tax=unclassified Cobetia TaxID=2609414 RepID=UPI00209749B2|nr:MULTISPECIES: TolC family protein [unclassified Cobetia]MCO7233875.1 TolC family protein [Cobetia sp. Dlab-2-AX]MCO7237235.1 TolC family protein [Cobetia sp. Dlab-2-U]
MTGNEKTETARALPESRGRGRLKTLTTMAAISAAGIALSACGTVQPEPLDRQDIATAIQSDEVLFEQMTPVITEPLDLNQAMARALKYNLDNRVKLMEQALAEQSFNLAKMDMLPVLAANAGFTSRNNEDASSSENVRTGVQSLAQSTSVDKDRTDADLRLSWNVLDFGVSYLKAKQEADRFLIVKNARRDIMAKLLQQTRSAYWKAAVTQKLKPRIDALLVDTEKALAKLDQIQRERLRAPLDVLQEQRQLLSIMRNLKSLQRSVETSQIELASLINQAPNVEIPLQAPSELPELPPLPSNDLDVLERVALANSGEYVGQLYNARIAQREARKSMVRLLPGLEFSYSANYDSNSYLYNDTWAQAGVRVSWNIFRLFAIDEIKAQNEARDQMVEARRLASNMATLARVNLGWQQYHNSLDSLAIAQRFQALDEQIADFSKQARASQAISGTQSLLNQAKALNSVLSNSLAYADAQDAYGGFLFSLGFNPVPEDYQRYDVDTLASNLDASFRQWSGGSLPLQDPALWLEAQSETTQAQDGQASL